MKIVRLCLLCATLASCAAEINDENVIDEEDVASQVDELRYGLFQQINSNAGASMRGFSHTNLIRAIVMASEYNNFTINNSFTCGRNDETSAACKFNWPFGSAAQSTPPPIVYSVAQCAYIKVPGTMQSRQCTVGLNYATLGTIQQHWDGNRWWGRGILWGGNNDQQVVDVYSQDNYISISVALKPK